MDKRQIILGGDSMGATVKSFDDKKKMRGMVVTLEKYTAEKRHLRMRHT